MRPGAKLLDRVRHAIRTRHYSSRTEEAYVHWIRRYIVFHEKKHPSTLGAADISRFLTWLAVARRVSASTQNQALSAVLFLYKDVLVIEVGDVPPAVRARTPERLPVVLSRDEIAAILQQLAGAERLMVMLLYGAGLRLDECLELRVKDLDFDRRQIIVRQGKGQKDRVTMLPAAAAATLRGQLTDVRRLHAADLARGFGRVVLPFAVNRKYPGASTEWRWQFVFPAGRICRDPRFGKPTRYHLHASVVQKAVARAGRLAGVTKRLSPHVMRQHAGSRIMPSGSTEPLFSFLLSSICRLPIRHNPALVFAAAYEPRRGKACWNTPPRSAARTRNARSSARTSSRLQGI